MLSNTGNISSAGTSSGQLYVAPGALFSRYTTDPLRLFIIVSTWLCLFYGTRTDLHTPFHISFLENIAGAVFSGVELMMLISLALEIIRRLALNDFRIERSPLMVTTVVLLAVMGIYPLLHMFVAEGRFRVPLELWIVPMTIGYFFCYLFLFRRQELQLMTWLVLSAGALKAVEGVVIFLESGVSWGLLGGWRDGMLLSLMLLGAVLAFIIKPQGDVVYARMRRFLFVFATPVIFSFIGSMRRSYMIGIVLILLMLPFLLKGPERRSYLWILLLTGGLVMFSVVVIGPQLIGDRMTGISDPTSEGSALYRILESYNAWQMILVHPVFGWPYGADLRNYTNINLDIVSSVIPHNIYLYMILRAGLFGIAAWIAWLYTITRMGYRTIRAATTPYQRFMASWLGCVALLLITTGFTTPVLVDRMSGFLPFLLVMGGYLHGAWSDSMKLRALKPAAD